MSIRIVADSSCDLTELPGVDFVNVPLTICSDEKDYVDDAALDIAAMVEDLRHYKGRSGTSCPSIGAWHDAFAGADEVFAFTITSGLSGSYNAAVAAKDMIIKENPGRRIHIFNTLSAGPEILLAVEKTCELAADGADFDSIRDWVTAYQERTRLLFALESLHNFAQNGRVSKVAAAACGVLGIRALGQASDHGTLELLAKCRGAKHTLAGFIEQMKKMGYHCGRVIIAHCFNEDGAVQLKADILSQFGKADVKIRQLRGLCSYYAERGGILVGFEC